MTRWEYWFILLQQSKADPHDAYGDFLSEVRKAGAEGWEAVGEVTVRFQTGRGTSQGPMPLLMFKRPAGES